MDDILVEGNNYKLELLTTQTSLRKYKNEVSL